MSYVNRVIEGYFLFEGSVLVLAKVSTDWGCTDG